MNLDDYVKRKHGEKPVLYGCRHLLYGYRCLVVYIKADDI